MVKMLVLVFVKKKKEFPKYWCVKKFIFSQGLNGVFGENLNEATLLGDGKLLGLQRGSSGHVDELKAGSYEWQTVWDKYISGYKFVVITFFGIIESPARPNLS